ncbi:probable inactive ATP-dependent zinc metalloprotease FTSHI 3, chloroplastic [Cucurbita pepo subsp. pepo]|uniref:probable inactive ATP-dependent zinc metalloprotease FTSHI 3, chloroplastic n=1 Tax=Cucurbita pepo subsp. pepo TaxID=3664 RepID=UPI000C9D301A|nr:probable inactive ATP-dependent zinc metalloprotease FTSHI 3, chloroplastic [Cucurbita pepo subsp. pepo]
MAGLSIVCNNRYSLPPGSFGAHINSNKHLWRYRNFSCSSVTLPPMALPSTYLDLRCQLLCNCQFRVISNGQWRFSCNSKLEHMMNDKMPPLGSSKRNNNLRRKFGLRLRPRLRLLSKRLRTVSVRSAMNNVRTFIRKNVRKVSLSASVCIVLGLCYLFLKVTAVPPSKNVPYSDFITSLQNGTVTKVLLEEGSRRIYFNRSFTESIEGLDSKPLVVDSSNGSDKGMNDDSRAVQAPKSNLLTKFSRRSKVAIPEWKFSTRKVDHDEKFLLGLMREKGTTYSSAPQSVLMSMRTTLITIISLWIPLIPLMWLLYRQLSASNTTARKRQPNSPMVGFEDVEGVDGAKVELMEVVSCLQGAISYQKLGAKLPKGVLLVGPPGTGKTLLARAVAGEAGVPFFSVSASEFVEMFVGRGAARIRDLFSVARKCAPSIVFIDELDAVGGKRGRSFNDERDQTLNQLLTEMDGFESDTKVIVIAATNRPEALDPALCRPGRFSRKVLVGQPDEEGRRKILAVHLRDVPLEENPNLICSLVASLTPGYVGADLANIVNEAALLAARRGGETLSREDFMEAIERSKFGINNKKLRSNTINTELERLFPWMTALMGRNDTKMDGSQGPLGYQTLS